jgi:hypothetical protein
VIEPVMSVILLIDTETCPVSLLKDGSMTTV